MGSVWNMYIGEREFDGGGHNHGDFFARSGFLLDPFQPEDLDTSQVPDPTNPGNKRVVHRYRALVKTVARRLDILGHTLRRARIAYDEGVQDLSDYELEHWPTELLGPGGFDRWMQVDAAYPTGAGCHACGVISRPYPNATCPECGHRGPASPLGDDFHGFPKPYGLLVLRCLVERYPPQTLVTLDLTDLLDNGFISEEPDPERFQGRTKTLIVTEGKSDSRLLRRAIDILFHEYRDFFSFIDYETANARGGTAELVQFVKMLTGCGIKNRMVVLFDNDAAGHDALAQVQRNGNLPENVFALTLPSLDLFEFYPTLGPDGPARSDIDGRACSLELYLGMNALTDPQVGEIPIRWGGFNERLGRYQGAISNRDKGQVQERFERILEEVEQEPEKRDQYDFSGVEAVFEAIVAALASR
jgi:HEPN/Toprim N-terminal domain 1